MRNEKLDRHLSVDYGQHFPHGECIASGAGSMWVWWSVCFVGALHTVDHVVGKHNPRYKSQQFSGRAAFTFGRSKK